MRIEIAPGLAYGLSAARHGDRAHPRQPSIAEIIGQQELAAPDRPVIAEADAVKDDAEDRRTVERISVLGETGGDMGVMMLHFENGQRVLWKPRCARVSTTNSQGAGRSPTRPADAHTAAIKRDGSAIFVESRCVFEIALMLRQNGLTVFDQTERRLEFAAHGRECPGRTCKPAGNLIGLGAKPRARRSTRAISVHDPDDGIIDPVGDPAVVNERAVGDAGELLARFGVVDDRRFLGELPLVITSGTVDILQQQKMQRGRRQHEAERAETGRDRRRQPAAVHRRRASTIGACAGGELAFFLGADRSSSDE